MNDELQSFYGELVIPFGNNNQPEVMREVEAMQDQKRIMIEEAAFYLAEKRNFAAGREVDDWIQAEKTILK